MIQRMSHAGIFVADQDQAKRFYVDKLGFEARHDEKLGTFRWVTVSPKGQRDFEIILMPLKESPMMDAATVSTLIGLQKKGKLGAGVFEVDDCKRTYEELKAKGVQIDSPPAERPYGIEMIIRDDSGNWFSVVERRVG